MTGGLKGNEAKIRALYDGSGPRAAFSFVPPGTAAFALPGGDYTVSDLPIDEYVPILVSDYEKWVEFSTAVGDDSVPFVSLMTGTHIYAEAFGCEVHRFDDSNPCALPKVFSASEAENLAEPDISASRALSRVFSLAEAIRSKLGNDVPLGVPDMQTGFDTTCLIWEKADLYCAMADPDTSGIVKHVNNLTASLLKKFLTSFRSANPNCSPCHCPKSWCPPELGPWLSNDECGAISVDMFEEFCLPELIDISNTFGGIGMHCCADAEHQFPSFKKIPDFYAFNRVCGTLRGKGFDPSLDAFGGPEGLVHVLAWIDDEEAIRLMTKYPDSRFIFVFYPEEKEIDSCRRRLDILRSTYHP